MWNVLIDPCFELLIQAEWRFLDGCAIFRMWGLANTSGLPLKVVSWFPGPQYYENFIAHSLVAITIKSSHHGDFKLSELKSQNKALPFLMASAI